MNDRLRRVATFAGMASAAAFLVASPASAADGDLVVTVDGGGPMFDVEDIYPGFEAASQITVRNATDLPGMVGLRISELVSDDNGCNHPEARVDATCGDGDGELGDELVLTVERRVAPGTFRLVDGPTALAALSAGVRLEEDLAPGSERDYRITMTLPASSGNETQTDTVQFEVEVFGAAVVGSSGRGLKVEGDEATPSVGDDRDIAAPPLDDLNDRRPTVEDDGKDKYTDVLDEEVSIQPHDDSGMVTIQSRGTATGMLPRTGSEPMKLWIAGLASLLIGVTSALLGREVRLQRISR